MAEWNGEAREADPYLVDIVNILAQSGYRAEIVGDVVVVRDPISGGGGAFKPVVIRFTRDAHEFIKQRNKTP